MKQHHRFLSRRYLLNALERAKADKSLRPALLEWMDDNHADLDDVDADFLIPPFRKAGLADKAWQSEAESLFGRNAYRQDLKIASVRRKAETFLRSAVTALRRSLAEPPVEDPESSVTGIVVRRFGLDAAAGQLLDLVRLYNERGLAQGLWDHLRGVLGDHQEVTATLLGTTRTGVEGSLRRLSEVGIADPATWGVSGADPDDYADNWFHRVYSPPVLTEDELRERLVPLAPAPLLELDAFDQLDGRDEALRLLSAAIRSRRAVRLLLYGRAGTGKTEFSKTLARAAGARLYDLCDSETAGVRSEEDTNGVTDRSADKRNRLRMALALLATEPGAAILIDEVEDVLSSEPGSRRENHRLLEDAAVPLIFTGNDLKRFDEAVLRRFDLTIRFKAHSPTRRRSVVRRMLRNARAAGLREEDHDPLAIRLADELECPPGIIERAIRSTRLVEGSADDLFHFAERHEWTVSAHIARPRLGPPVKAELPWEAFQHLGQPAEDFRRLLTATLCARRDGAGDSSGVTFLAYGPPGCGKTEFCRTVAAEAGATLYSVGGREQGPDARLAVRRNESLEYAIEALADEPEAVILFDELEDYGTAAKHWLNGLAESTPVPLLFTANAIDALRWSEPFFLDRLTYSLEFEHLPRGRRASMFAGLLRGADEMESLADELAADRRVKPRQVRNAGRVAVLSGGGAAAARRAVGQQAQLLHGKRTVEPRAAEKYDLSLVRANPDLEMLTTEIAAVGPCRMGILLDGPSGSGKSEYAKQLAKRMDLDPLPKRASQLMSKWVGETEQKIAGAFAEARTTGSFLIIDEADSFLADRRDAFRNWEISMVNEMLSQLENHDLPYAFTTNLADRLDPAAARRFLFRATFRFLDEPRVVRAWEFFFEGECPAGVRSLARLVPADFALVHERAGKLRYLDDPKRIAAELVTQSRDKHRAGTVGF